MIDVHPSFIERDGRAEFVVLPIEEYQMLQAHLEDMEDLVELRQAKEAEGSAETVTLDELKQQIGSA